MTDISPLTSIDQVPFEIWDLTEQASRGEGYQPGFYYTFPADETEELGGQDKVLAGPYPTKVAAVQAALDFISGCLNEAA